MAIAAISFVLHIISLKKWFDNRVKNEKLLEMIQFLQTGNEKLAERMHTIESGNYNLTGKFQPMSMRYEALQNGPERLSKRIHTVETDSQNLLKKKL